MNYNSSRICALLVTLLMLSVTVSNTQSAIANDTLIVDDDGTADFTSIQDAVDAANFGDTISVNPGIYDENVAISQSGITLQGTDPKTTIINSIFASDVSDITINGFTANQFVFEGNNLNVMIENNIIIGDDNWWHNVIYDYDTSAAIDVIFDDGLYTGVTIYGDSNTLRNNVILNTLVGLEISGNDNFVYNNDFVTHSISVVVLSGSQVTWDDGSSGNYWGDYIGIDESQDGIGDSPYVIDGTNQDNYPLLEMRVPDLDHDGIYNDLDPQPLEFSKYFTDVLKGGGFHGLLLRGDQTVTIKDEPAPYGLRFIVHPSEIVGLAGMLSFPTNYTFTSGTDAVLTFGSEHIKVNEGTVEAEFLMYDGSKLLTTLVAGDEIVFEPSTLEIANTGENTVTALAFGEDFIIEPGTQIRFTPSVEFTPDTLALQSFGKWITAYIEPSITYDVTEIDFESIKVEVNGIVFDPDPQITMIIGDFDNDGITDLKLNFLRNAIISSFDPVDCQSINEVQFTIIASYTDGRGFSCSDTIRVLVSKNN